MIRLLPLSLLALAPALLAPAAHANNDDVPVVTDEASFASFGDDEEEDGSADGLLVDFDDALDNDDIATLMRDAGVSLVDTTDAADGNLFTFRGTAAETARVVEALAGQRGIESVEPNTRYSLFDQDVERGAARAPVTTGADDASDDGQKPGPVKPNDPMYKSQWHFDMVNAEGAWAVTQGNGVIVAVIDTGVAPGKLDNGKPSKWKRVPDLKETEFVAGFNFVDNNADPSDGNGHGTHVAGTIAQSTNNAFGVAGLAPKAKIMPIKVLSDRGSGSLSDIVNGIRFAADHGAKVINMSLGGGMYSSSFARAVKYAHDKGVTVACAAGNGGRQKVEYPAAYEGCVAVSALGPDGKLAFYSSYGKELDIAAPGGDTRVDLNKDGLPDGVLQNTIGRGDPTKHGFFPFQGTSMATPHVAAAAALVISMGVTDPDRVEKVLEESSKPLNDAIRFGAGGLDAAAAVKKATRDHTGGGLAFALGLTGLGLWRARRRDGWMSTAKATPGMAVGAVVGSGALLAFAPPGLGAWAGWMALGAVFVAVGPFLFLFGVKSARSTLAGLGFGVAGFALVRAILGSVDVALVPGNGGLDMAFLVGTAVIAAGVGALSLKK